MNKLLLIVFTFCAFLFPQEVLAQCYQNGVPCGQAATSTGGTPASNSNINIYGSDGANPQPILTDSTGKILTNISALPPLPTGTNTIGSISSITNPVAVTGTFYQATQPVSQSGTWNVGITGTPTVNLGTIGGIALDTSVQQVKTTLGSPFQAGASIGNTTFGAKLQDATGAAFGTSGNPIYTTGGGTSSVTNAGTFAVQNTAAIPAGTNTIGTVNLGTIGTAATAAKQDAGNTSLSTIATNTTGLATSAKQDAIISSLGTPLQAGGTVKLDAGTNIVGNFLRSAYFTETTTPLAASTSFTPSTARDSGVAGSPGVYNTFSCFVLADADGRAKMLGSVDGTNWYTELNYAYTASVSMVMSQRVFARYHKCTVTNGTTAQSTLILNSQLGQ